jgi:DNA-binding MarR family transcriptional regulator
MATGHEIAMALRGAYLAMHRRSNAQFARHGVTADQFVILATLAGEGTVTQRELARRTSSDQNTVRAMLLLLEKRGFVARDRHPTDGRALTVALTPKGRRAYRALWSAGEPARERLLAPLGPGEPDVLLELLTRVAQALVPSSGVGPTAEGEPAPVSVSTRSLA